MDSVLNWILIYCLFNSMWECRVYKKNIESMDKRLLAITVKTNCNCSQSNPCFFLLDVFLFHQSQLCSQNVNQEATFPSEKHIGWMDGWSTWQMKRRKRSVEIIRLMGPLIYDNCTERLWTHTHMYTNVCVSVCPSGRACAHVCRQLMWILQFTREHQECFCVSLRV